MNHKGHYWCTAPKSGQNKSTLLLLNWGADWFKLQSTPCSFLMNIAGSYFCMLPNSFLTRLKKPLTSPVSYKSCSETNLWWEQGFVLSCQCDFQGGQQPTCFWYSMSTVYSRRTCTQHNTYSHWKKKKKCGGQQVWQSCPCQSKKENHWMMLWLAWSPVLSRQPLGSELSWVTTEPAQGLGFGQRSCGFRKTLSDKQEPTMSHAPNFATSDRKCMWQLSFESK